MSLKWADEKAEYVGPHGVESPWTSSFECFTLISKLGIRTMNGKYTWWKSFLRDF